MGFNSAFKGLISSLTYAWCPLHSRGIWSSAVIGIDKLQIIMCYWSRRFSQFCWSMSPSFYWWLLRRDTI